MLSLMEVYSMTDTTPLSPAAQAVMDACEWDGVGGSYKRAAAAALRAAADQLSYCLDGSDYYVIAKDDILAIANELEAQ